MDSDKNPALPTINSGSSSLEFALFAIHEAGTPDCLFRGKFTAIGNVGQFRIKNYRTGETDGAPALAKDISRDLVIADHAQALRILLQWIVEQQPALQLTAAGHHIVHRGRRLHAPLRVTDDTLGYLNTLIPLGTRCGGIEWAVVLYLLNRGMTAEAISDLLYFRSGLLGLSGETDDMAALLVGQPTQAHTDQQTGQPCPSLSNPHRRRFGHRPAQPARSRTH